MTIRLTLCLLLTCGTFHAWAQGPSIGRTSGSDARKKKSTTEETKSKAIEAATSLYKAVPDDVKDKAKDMLNSPEAIEARQKALKAAQEAMRNKEGAAGAASMLVPGLIGGNPTPAEATPTAPAPAPMATTEQPPATPTPQPTTTPSVTEAPPAATGPQPRPLKPLNLDEAPTATKGQIVITAQKSAYFDANKGYGVYTGDVKARHPQMYIECEELEIFMSKQEGNPLGASKAAPAKDSDIVSGKKKSKDAAPPIEKADARGPMVTVEKVSEQGELQVGHCKHLIYDGKTGNTTLMEWPQVQVGNKLHKATEPGCVMVIDQKGMLTTTGGHQTIILQGEEATPRSRSGATPAQQ